MMDEPQQFKAKKPKGVIMYPVISYVHSYKPRRRAFSWCAILILRHKMVTFKLRMISLLRNQPSTTSSMLMGKNTDRTHTEK